MTTAIHTGQLDLLGYRPPQPKGWTYQAHYDQARLTSNLQRVLYLLLDGEFHTLAELRRVGGSAADSRVRELRDYYHLPIPPARRRPGQESSGVWEYRLATGLVTREQVEAVFGGRVP